MLHSQLTLNIGYFSNTAIGNILPDSHAAPGIQGQQKTLEKHMRADSLNEKLANRPKPEDLLNKGVLTEDPTSYEEKMEDEYAKREGGA